MKDAAVAETIGSPPEATLSLGPGPPPGHDSAQARAPTGEPSTIVTPGSPAAGGVSFSAGIASPAKPQWETQAETTDGSPSLGMASADLDALRRATLFPSRRRAWLGILGLLAASAAAVTGFVMARPDQAPITRPGAIVGHPNSSSAGQTTATSDRASPPMPAESPSASPKPEVAVAGAAQQAGTPAPPPQAQTVARKPAPPPEPALARVVVRTQPTGATLRRGDRELCRTPCDLRLPTEEQPVRTRLVRKGYEPEDLVLSLRPGADILREVLLDRTPAQRRRKLRAPRVSPRVRVHETSPATTAPTKTKPKPKPKPREPLPGIRMTR